MTPAAAIGVMALTLALGLTLVIGRQLATPDTLLPRRWEPVSTRHTHPCWAEYDPARLAAAAREVHLHFEAIRAELRRPPVMGQPR